MEMISMDGEKEEKDKRISSSRQYFLVDLKKKEIINLFFFSFFVLLYIRAFFTVVFSINP
jgi:hypothetical protein